jgi:FkbM family methyltransferase
VRKIPITELFGRLPETARCKRLTAQWFTLSTAYSSIVKLHYPFAVRLYSGQTLVLREFTDVITFWLVFVRGHYPVDSLDKTIIDVGANIGVFTLYAARCAPMARIISAEPFPDTAERLKETIQANGIGNRVFVVNSAITGTTGTVLMDRSVGVPSQYRSVLSDVPRSLNKNYKQQAQVQESIYVSTMTLEELLDIQNLNNVDLLKMNIHGNEYEVLLSSSPSVLRRFRRVALQYHEIPKQLGISKKDLFRQLQNAGFTLISDTDTGRGAGRAILSLHN